MPLWKKVDDLIDTMVEEEVWEKLPPHIQSKILGIRIYAVLEAK